MEAIKKKMQAMKLEKDNAVDRAETAEQQARDANLRAEKVNFLFFNKFTLFDFLFYFLFDFLFYFISSFNIIYSLMKKSELFKRKSNKLKMN